MIGDRDKLAAWRALLAEDHGVCEPDLFAAVNMIERLVSALDELVSEFDADSARAAEQQGCGGLEETWGITMARSLLDSLTPPEGTER